MFKFLCEETLAALTSAHFVAQELRVSNKHSLESIHKFTGHLTYFDWQYRVAHALSRHVI